MRTKIAIAKTIKSTATGNTSGRKVCIVSGTIVVAPNEFTANKIVPNSSLHELRSLVQSAVVVVRFSIAEISFSPGFRIDVSFPTGFNFFSDHPLRNTTAAMCHCEDGEVHCDGEDECHCDGDVVHCDGEGGEAKEAFCKCHDGEAECGDDHDDHDDHMCHCDGDVVHCIGEGGEAMEKTCECHDGEAECGEHDDHDDESSATFSSRILGFAATLAAAVFAL